MGKMRQYFTIIIIIFSINLVKADSPLTSIKFWDLSDDLYIHEIGKIPGKPALDKTAFQYLIDPTNSIANKYALINAFGWEFKSEIKNSDLFLEFVQERFKKEITEFYHTSSTFLELGNNEILTKSFIETNLDCEYSLFYDYLFALDNYIDLNKNELILLNDVGYLLEVDYLSIFIARIIQSQHDFLNLDFESISDSVEFLNSLNFSSYYNLIFERGISYLRGYSFTN